MAIDLKTLAEQTLIACDASYFTNPATDTPRPAGDIDPTHVYVDDTLTPLVDTDQSYAPQFIPLSPTPANPDPTDGFFVIKKGDAPTAGAKFIAYHNENTNSVILAFGGTDGLNAIDWKANLFSYGWSEWVALRDQVFDFLDRLRGPDGRFNVTVNFTGQSLGGALAQYAVYEYLNRETDLQKRQDDASHFTLTTFNALGGIYGLDKNEEGGFNASVLTGLSSAANIVIKGDIVSMLGGGFAAGPIYQLSFDPDQINPNTNLPYSETLGPVDSHRIESGFYANLGSDGINPSRFEVLAPSSYVLNSDKLSSASALLSNVLNAKGPFVGNEWADFLAGLSAATVVSDPVQFDAFYKAILKSANDTGHLDDASYALLNTLRFPTELAFRAIGAAATPVTLIAAGLADAFDLGLEGIQSAFSSVSEFLGLTPGQVAAAPSAVSPDEYEMKMVTYLSAVPGSAATPLAQELSSLSVDSDTLASQLLIANSATWRTDFEALLRGDFDFGRLGRTIALADAFNRTMDMVPELDSSTLATLEQERDTFILDTAKGIVNAISDSTQDFTGVNFNLGQSLDNFADVQLIEQSYEAELKDPRLSSSVREVAKEALNIIQEAGQTVVISTGVGRNPFDTPGFVPGGASSATVEEKLGQEFRLSLLFAAGSGGQRVSLQLQGPQANQLSVSTGNGVQALGANGTFELTVPEGDDQLYFSLMASNDISSDATVTLSATLVDANNQPTHTTQIESVVSVKAFVGTTDERYGTNVEDYSSITDPSIGVPMGSGGFYHQTLIGGAGPDSSVGPNLFGDDKIYGNGGDDFLEGGRGHDEVYGGEGNDTLIGDYLDDVQDQPWTGFSPGDPGPDPRSSRDGKDYLDGGAGNDLLGGGGSDDRLIGGAGDDVLWGDVYTGGYTIPAPDGGAIPVYLSGVLDPGNDVLEGGDGNDYLSGDGGNDTLDGGTGDDFLVGDTEASVNATLRYSTANPGDDFLSGGAGNDTLNGNAGNDVLLGGEGNDILWGDDQGADASQEGNDWLEGGAGTDQLFGLGGNDTLIGGAGADILFGGDGNDSLDGSEGDDAGFGGAGNDTILGGSGADQFDGEAGNDVMFGDDGNDLLIGGDGVDELDGGAGDDLLGGGADADTIFGGSGNDELQGGMGDDLLVSDEGDDRVFGQEGDDQILGGDGNDRLRGDDGNDELDGGAGDDILVGDADAQIGGTGGNDILVGGAGNDVLVGGGGQDTYLFGPGDGFDVIAEAAGEGNRLVFRAGISPNAIVATVGPNDSLVVRTGNGEDTVQILNFGPNNLAGVHPIDSFEFSNGTILTYAQLASSGLGISGGADSDTLSGTAQNDRMYGGPGQDTISGFDGADILLGEDGADRLEGGADSDVLLGGSGDDILLGGTGNDRLVGGIGSDILFGEEGADVLEGGGGNDNLEGEAGSDTLIGGSGNDQLSGGDGSDTYRFNLGDGRDVLFDAGASTDTDTVVFGSGITSSALTLSADSGQILVKVGAGSDGIFLGNTSDVLGSQTIEQFQFADGTSITYADLVARGFDIDGTEFDDFLAGTNVVDRFRGGLGNDRLEGGEGNDSYFFNLGDGIDTIVDTSVSSGGNEIVFGAGISPADLRLDLASDQSDFSLSDLLIRVGAGGDAIQLDTFDRNNALGPRTVENFRFADGSTLTYDQLLVRGFDLAGTNGDDRLLGTNITDRMTGGDGSDVLRGGSGDDTLDGGFGNDRLFGGQGNDTYVFGPGSGQDTMTELQGSLDTIRMAPGVAPSDVVVTRNDRDLVFSLNGGADRLTVSLYFLASPLQIERVQFADGTVWNQAFIDNLVQPTITGTGEPDVLVGTNNDDRLAGLAGDDQLTGLAGNDHLDGGTGADQLTGGAGDDTYIVDDAGDVVTELANEGVDTIQSSVTHALEPNVERLTLAGTEAINGTGNDLDNVLTGNSAANMLTGGLGNDTYVMGAGDTVVELAGEGTDTVQTGVSTALGANVENLTLTGSASLSGRGNALDNVLRADGSMSVLAGGDGNDTYILGFNSDDDILVETAAGGIDTVIVAHDYRLSASIENLTVLDPSIPNFEDLSFTRGLFQNIPSSSSGKVVAGYGNDLANVLNGGRANNVLDGGLGTDTMIGGAGNDTYVVDNSSDIVIEQANEGMDTVQASADYVLSANVENLALVGTGTINGTGNAMNNIIAGNESANVLDGGAGNDFLQGLGGADTYLFSRGTGQDTVFDSSVTGEVDTVQMAADVLPTDVGVYQRPGDLVLTITGTEDELTLANFFGPSEYALKQVRFADGTVWNEAELRAQAVAVGGTTNGTTANDNLVGGVGHDTLVGNEGNDILTGGLGNDVLYGDAQTNNPFFPVIGNDTLLGGAGDDILRDFQGTNLFDGGIGNDTLYLGAGQDTVLFGRGSGVDLVTLDNNGSDLDIIQMGAGISPADVVMTRRIPDDQIVDLFIPDSGDRLSVVLSANYPAVGVDSTQAVVRFADGTEWNLAWFPPDFNSATGTQFDDVVSGFSGDVLRGLAGNDTYNVGAGNGPIVELPGEGADTVRSAVDYTLPANVENLLLMDNFTTVGPYADNATGNELDNLIIGNARDNILDGSAGNDVLVGGLFRSTEGFILGGTGSDVLIGGTGDDVLMADGGNIVYVTEGGGGSGFREDVPREADDLFIGGVGNDTYVLHSQQETVVEFANEGVDTVRSTVDYVLGDNVENLTLLENLLNFLPGPLLGAGNELDNVLIGNSEDNILRGEDGNDTLWGGRGLYRDSEAIQSGNDLLLGGAGNDTYLFKFGDGIDSIDDTALPGAGNRIQFGTGITRNDLTFTQDQAARILTIQVGSSGTDQLVLTNFDPTGANGSLAVETLAFADGSEVSLASLLGPSITIFGTDTGEVLVGTSGEDGIDAGAGNDMVYANGGNDLVLAGDGDDVVTGDEGADTLFGGAGTDYLYGGEGDDVVSGDDGNDVVVGDAGNDVLSGGVGNDVLNGGVGADQLFGGEGDDTLYIDAADTAVNGGAGYDAVTVVGLDAVTFNATAAEVEFAAGSSGNDVFTAVDSLTGVTFYGGEGDDQLTGGDGNDVLVGQTGNDLLTGGLGDDILNGGDGGDVLTGEVGNDTFYGGAGNDQLNGGDGNDALSGDEGADTLLGGAGTDYLYGGDGDDVVNGDEGNDVVVGDTGNDVLSGGAGNDVLNGGLGSDQLSGGDGDDTLYIDAADTAVNGGAGYDVVTVLGIDAVTFNATAAEVEYVAGSSGNDVFTAVGSLSSVTFYGGEGYDQLTGGDGNDVLVGQAGNDTLTGGLGNDVLNGGEGDDVLTGDAGNDTFYGGAGSDLVNGDAGDDALSGDEGADTLSGGAGTDYLYGGEGDDVVSGDDGNDVVVGDAGNDVLAGGLGDDYLVGGTGNDSYIFALGDGADTLSEDDSTAGNSDSLLFGNSINPLDLVLSRQANDLRLAIHGTTEQVVIENWYLGDAHQVENVQAGNGQALLSTQVDQLIQAMASFSQQSGLTWDQAIDQRPQDVQTVLAASWR